LSLEPVLLQLLHMGVELLAKDNLIKLLKDRAIKPLTDFIRVVGK
jgi:hypothetical protein